MKYTRTDSGIVEVKGCFTCPHVRVDQDNGFTVMYCMKPLPGKLKTDGRNLISKWTGAYHASCPLASEAKNVPEVVK